MSNSNDNATNEKEFMFYESNDALTFALAGNENGVALYDGNLEEGVFLPSLDDAKFAYAALGRYIDAISQPVMNGPMADWEIELLKGSNND